MNKLSLSVIMPALNEANNIKDAVTSTLNSFKKYSIDGEVIVVNDGSKDDTKKIVEGMIRQNNKVKLINHDTPKGIGYSYFHGVKHSNCDVVVLIPGDNETLPEDALSFFSLMESVDIIVPFIHNIEVRDRLRRLLSSLYRLIIAISFGINLNYTNGTVLYRRSILSAIHVKSTGFFYQAEMLIKLIRKGYLYAEVPNFLAARSGGSSKALSFKSFLNVTIDYFRLMIEIHIKAMEAKKNFTQLSPQSVTYKKLQYFNRHK